MITLLIKKLDSILSSNDSFKKLLGQYNAGSEVIKVEGPEGFFIGYLVSRLADITGRGFLIIVPSVKEALALVSDLRTVNKEAVYFSSWDTIPYSGNTYQLKNSGDRMKVLTGFLTGKNRITVTTLKAFVTPLPSPEFIKAKLLTIAQGNPIDTEEISENLSSMRYMRVPRVTVPGEYSLKGEVLDIYMPGDSTAVRIVFEWDEVEAIRRFDPVTQVSLSSMEQIVIYPCTEILWDNKKIEKVETIAKNFDKIRDSLYDFGTCPHEEIFFPLAFDRMYSILDYIGRDTVSVLVSDERLNHAFEVVKKENRELYIKARGNGDTCIHPDLMSLDFVELQNHELRKIIFPTLRNSSEKRIKFPFDGPRSFFGNLNYLKEELDKMLSIGYSVYIFAETEAQAERIRHLLKDYTVEVISERISEGFSLPDMKFSVIAENEIFGRRKRMSSSVKKVQSQAIDTFVELNPGDFIVHVNYGIGRFKGIERIKAAGTERDYIQLEYAGEETIFIPIEQVNLVQRYIGKDGRAPGLDKIGGKAWENRKKRVRKSVEDLAEMLIALYAKRKNTKGFPFPEDTDWQLEFEATFPFEETPDQIKCIEDVKMDMESPRPMDRLICGDVGYGKTEVAMRAAFKAVVSGKQVAFLAPTTILAEQHYENFTDRFNKFPVKIKMISRFVPKKEQKRILEDLKDGKVDLIIGTHRIIQKDVIFKNLGLLIIDEEQRFGVKDKEKLKEIKHSVDCLSLSATPIPRTLHMSLLKIRDMSLLSTAPFSRRPIETIIQEFDEAVIADAVRREIARGGQVFYLHNRVETLTQTRIFLENLLPEVMIETAHGQLTSTQLEDVMYRFIHGSFQILVATTIIENGIDIPNVNTIIIDRADMYGVSQLYQLRGRVGRSDKKAYAYLLYPDRRALSEIAMKRLTIISDFTDLGSGFKIAMKDLEVRGAGNLLGRQQSGDILSVGFDMYLKILDDAIADLSDANRDEAPEVYLDLNYSGYIPESYISNPVEKMEIYKKIASVQTDFDLDTVLGELQDRFGPLPDEVNSLISISELRILCKKLYIHSVVERHGVAKINFSKVSIISVDKILRLIKESKGIVKLDPEKPNILTIKTKIIGLKDKSEFIREKLQILL